MKIVEAKDYNEMSRKAADYIIKKIQNSPKLNLGLATGGTPVGIYQNLIKDHQLNGTSYTHIATFNLDEYVGLSPESPNSYRFYMNHKLFNHIDINIGKTHVPHGNAHHLHEECLRYERLIAENGGIDLQILGIGANGHIGFNEPGTSFQSITNIVDLTPSTREANARYFPSLSEVPTQAITMGISTIMKSKEIILLVSGENKAEAFSKFMIQEIDEKFPASILKNHPCVTIIADTAAMKKVKVHC
ncbi:MAG: glucosamine-6-phosphate deaminase [Bacillota bacterium]|nr:glucosamine-6-phosphate deaminase [Bacillota bacterium]